MCITIIYPLSISFTCNWQQVQFFLKIYIFLFLQIIFSSDKSSLRYHMPLYICAAPHFLLFHTVLQRPHWFTTTVAMQLKHMQRTNKQTKQATNKRNWRYDQTNQSSIPTVKNWAWESASKNFFIILFLSHIDWG